jgi:hypothetical protein
MEQFVYRSGRFQSPFELSQGPSVDREAPYSRPFVHLQWMQQGWRECRLMRPAAPGIIRGWKKQRRLPFVCLISAAWMTMLLTTRPFDGHARKATGPITIDGKLNEPAWRDAEPMLLTQQSPFPGKVTPYGTEVRVLIVGDALVFGFNCRDPKPSAIQTHTLERDGNQNGDDTVTVILDSFGDKRTAYYFQINSVAARFDGLIAGPGDFSTDWDGIWDARTARTPDGWSAEIWIPAQTLTFVGSGGHWGLQLDRSIVRDQTELRWASPTLDADLTDMRRAGDLEIMSPLKQGHGIELAPYTDGKMLRNFDPTNRNWMATGGGEFTWRITPQLAAILSVNTDFAETEVDSRQINITPFPLYFPEKRAFFLEGANQYAFGLDLNQTYTFLPFFSRNVGLLGGYNIPLQGGLRFWMSRRARPGCRTS